MITLAVAREEIRSKYERNYSRWAVFGLTIPITLNLRSPTETIALANTKAVANWADEWHGVAGVEIAVKRWASLGIQHLPSKLTFVDTDEIARFCGRSTRWRLASLRATKLLELADDDTVVRVLRDVMPYSDREFESLLGVVKWLLANPNSGMFPRQLPIRGVDTKWLESHKNVVTRLVGSTNLGLAGMPDLVRLRFLDPSDAPGGLLEIAARLEHLAGLAVLPRHVLIVENLTTLLSLPQLPGVVAIHGSGYAVTRLAELPWLRESDVVYWGDLDFDGFNILARLRSLLPVRSILMDAATVRAHLDLAVVDNSKRTLVEGALTDGEHAALEALREKGPWRIEQERLPWELVTDTLVATFTSNRVPS
jgi:hypothetical protein